MRAAGGRMECGARYNVGWACVGWMTRSASTSSSRAWWEPRQKCTPPPKVIIDGASLPGWRELHGSCRHAIPPRTMYRMASTIARRQCFSGRPPRPAVPPGAGNSGSRIAHSASVTDDEYTAQPCPPAAWGGHDGHGEIGSWSGRDLVNHRPNQEPTSSVLREAHARPSRFSNTLLEAPRPCASLQARRQAAATSCIAGFVAAGCGRFNVFAGGSVMRYCRFFALAAG